MEPTRPSCIECVEKHLGAAMVLLTEHRDGYPYFMRAVGHLHEAEDESQAWPEVHNAIREARKHLQQTRTPPDFDALSKMVSQVRAGAGLAGMGETSSLFLLAAGAFILWLLFRRPR